MTVQSVCLGWHWQPYAYTRTADDTDGAPVKPLPADLRRPGPRRGRRRLRRSRRLRARRRDRQPLRPRRPSSASTATARSRPTRRSSPSAWATPACSASPAWTGGRRRSSMSGCAAAICSSSAGRRGGSTTACRRCSTATAPAGLGPAAGPAQHHDPGDGAVMSVDVARRSSTSGATPARARCCRRPRRPSWPPPSTTTSATAAGSRWAATGSARATTPTSPTRSRRPWSGSAGSCTRPWPTWPTSGASRVGAAGWQPWPATSTGMLARCHAAGQDRPTPLVLRYGPGGYNTLHQDLYGDVAFPLQVVVGLTEPGVGLHGRRVRAHRAAAPQPDPGDGARPAPRGEGIVFPNNRRPVAGHAWARTRSPTATGVARCAQGCGWPSA